MNNKKKSQSSLPAEAQLVLRSSKSEGRWAQVGWQKNLINWSQKPFIKQLNKRFPKAEVFLVGGAVRDAILNRETKDFDFVIRNVSKKELEKFLAAQGKVSLVGKKFGVFKFRPKGWIGEEIDIALPRTEHSINLSGVYKDFKINSNAKLNIEDDLSRRDFTINAMAFNITKNYQQKAKNYLIDPFSGMTDLKKGIIRAVGKPEVRFKEDYSRMLRAIRFACQLNFTIEPKTWQSIKKEIKNLNKTINNELIVPYEVIAKELVKALKENPIWAIELLDQANAIKILIPELLKLKNCPQPKNFHSEGDCWQHTILSIKTLNSKKFKAEFKNKNINSEIIWGLLFHDLGKPYTIVHADRIRFNNHDNVSAKKFREIAERLRLASAGIDINKVEKIISKHMLPTHCKASTLKDTTIEKYFFNQNFPGEELMMLIFADISATVPSSGKPDFTEYNILKKQINRLAIKNKNKKILPKPLVNGNDLIKEFKVKSSPKIGEILSLLREFQLKGKIKTKKQGLDLIKKKGLF